MSYCFCTTCFSIHCAGAAWRNPCPYIPSSAKSHWSLSPREQTIVERWSENEKKKNPPACSLSGHSRDRKRCTGLWPGTSSPPEFWFVWLALVRKEKRLLYSCTQKHAQLPLPICKMILLNRRLSPVGSEAEQRKCYFVRRFCGVLKK